MKLMIAICTLLALTCSAWAQADQSSTEEQESGKHTVQHIAHVTHAKTEPAYFVTDIGKPAFRLGDSVVFVNRTEFGPILTAKGSVEGVSVSEAEGTLTGIWTSKFADVQSSEVYVVSRDNSACCLATAEFNLHLHEAAELAIDAAKPIAYDDTTGKTAGGTVLNTSSESFIALGGRSSFHEGDIAVVVRPTVVGILLVGVSNIQRVYRDDLEGYTPHYSIGVRPEDGLFVINRATSDCSLARVSFRVTKQ